jgi:hypothetical protein
MAKRKVFITDRENRANYKVFFVRSDAQQKNHQLIYPGELVRSENQAEFKVFITDRENNADIKITPKNFSTIK